MNDPLRAASANRTTPAEDLFPSSASPLTARIGEIIFAREHQTIRTLLGSCVGVALYDKQKRQGILAHILLPDSNGHEGSAGKFVDTAIPEMLNHLRREGSNVSQVTARIAGGASMFELSSETNIGAQNLEALESTLKLHQIAVLGRHCGGTQGRRMVFTPVDGIVRIHIVGCDAIEI